MTTTAKRTEQHMEDLADALIFSLLLKVQTGTASAAELNIARQLMSDAGIQPVPVSGSDAAKLFTVLPFARPSSPDEEPDVPFSPSIKEA